MTEEEEKKYMLEYIDSGFNENHLLSIGVSSESVTELKSNFNELVNGLSFLNENSLEITPNLVGSWVKKLIELDEDISFSNFLRVQSKVAALLSNKLLNSTMKASFFNKNFNGCPRKLTENELKDLNLTEELVLPYLCKAVGAKTYFDIYCPNIYTKEELCSIDSILSSSSEMDEYIKKFNEISYKSYEDINIIYPDIKEYISDIKSNSINLLNSERYDSIDDMEESVKNFNFILLFGYIYINENKNDYISWKRKTLLYKYISMMLDYKYRIYNLYEDYIEKHALYLLFDTLNEPNAFDITQKEYIYEMAPKLRIASHLNQEYANYKKLYNPDARDFDFGKDEAEEEIAIEEQSIVKNNYEGKEIDDDQDTKKEADKRTHLPQLPHFKDDKKLLKLLQRFRKNDLNYIHKHTREEDWLFVFGLKGDTPPEGFEKVKWQGKNKKKPPTISPKKFINFLEILGYDLDELYNDVGLLNRCFIANEGNKEIHKKDFDCKKGKYGHVADYQELKKIVSEIGLCP